MTEIELKFSDNFIEGKCAICIHEDTCITFIKLQFLKIDCIIRFDCENFEEDDFSKLGKGVEG